MYKDSIFVLSWSCGIVSSDKVCLLSLKIRPYKYK